LREKLDKSPRVIVRINLNNIGEGIEAGVEKVLTKLSQPLKNISAGEINCPVYVFLDGLDEAPPQNLESVLSVIRFLLSDKAIIAKGWDEQVEFIEKRTGWRNDAFEHLRNLSWETRELMSKPLMLSMFCSVVDLLSYSKAVNVKSVAFTIGWLTW